jgi:tetratricopeptide (TPR) repeat protein
MNWRSARLIASVVVLTLGQPRAGLPQEPSPIAEVKSILREASALTPMIEAHQRWAVAANIAAQQTRAGDDEGALTSRSSANAPVGGVAYSLAVQGRLPEALQLIAPMPDGQEKALAYWQLTQGLLEVGKYDDALLVARLISKDPKEADRSLDILMQIYSAQWKAGDRQAAAATLSEAIKLAQRSPEIQSSRFRSLGQSVLIGSRRAAMYERVVHALALAGNRDDARTVVSYISDMAAQERDSEKKNGILSTLAEAQADIGNFAAALRTAEPLKSAYNGEGIFQPIAMEQARQGDVAAALATLARVPQGSAFVALLGMSRTLSDLGNYAGARAAVDKINDPGQRASALASLAFEQAVKDPAGAKLNVTLAWKLAQEARDKAPSYVFQNSVTLVAAARARMGDFAGSLEIINGPDLLNKAWPLACLVQGMVEAGNKDEALALARSQDAPLARADALLQIARSLMYQIETANNKAGPH